MSHAGSLSSSGSEFQTVGPATGKARRPYVLSRQRGTMSRCRMAERSRCRDATSMAGLMWSARYRGACPCVWVCPSDLTNGALLLDPAIVSQTLCAWPYLQGFKPGKLCRSRQWQQAQGQPYTVQCCHTVWPERPELSSADWRHMLDQHTTRLLPSCSPC